MSETSDNEEREPSDENRSAEDPLGSFDAFRARRAEERAENEPFPEQYEAAEEHEPTQHEPAQYEATQRFEPLQPYTAAQHDESAPYEPQQYDPQQYEPTQYAQPVPFTQSAADGGGRARGRLRSVAVLGGAAILVAGVVGGVYAATRSSDSPAAATSPSVAASATPSASAGALKGTKNGKALTARLTVTSVGSDSFTGTTAAGRTVTVQVTQSTKFGTAARPFDRSQLVTGAVVDVRVRRESDGTLTATVITTGTAGKGGGAGASASPSMSANTGA